MNVTETHIRYLSGACQRLLGRPESGALAFVRCLPEDVLAHCAAAKTFAPTGWEVRRVADVADAETRTITADMAVEQREEKGSPIFLLVDSGRAGAGMDGIYNAGREVDEKDLLDTAERLGLMQLDRLSRRYMEQALKTARQTARYTVTPWDGFHFLAQVLEWQAHPGSQLHHIGLWPISDSPDLKPEEALDTSRKLVDRLLGARATGLSVPARVDAIQLGGLDGGRRAVLERFLDQADALPIREAVHGLGDKPQLWVGVLRVNSERIEAIDLSSWRGKTGKLARWSGLVQTEADAAPALVFRPDPKSATEYTTLEVRWQPRPSGIAKGTVDYRVEVVTTMDEELAVRDVTHSARRGGERCRFTNDDFDVGEDSVISAKVVVSVPGDESVHKEESEEFVIRCGDPPERTASGTGRRLRTFSEGLIELGNGDEVCNALENPLSLDFDEKRRAAVLRTQGGKRLSFQVPCPPLLREVEKQWLGGGGMPGRWRVQVRMSGDHAGAVTFLPVTGDGAAWDRVRTASRRVAKAHGRGGVVGQVWHSRSARAAVQEYILAWTAFLEADRGSNPELALCNTVEVQSTAGRTIGLIVLPMHPLRAAWHVSYDDLAFHAAFEQEQSPSDVRKELGCLDGAMFPAFLPNPAGGTFVYADMLGFHGVGMVGDTDKEPKAAVSILGRAWSGPGSTDSAPLAGERSAVLVGDEIGKYLDCHTVPRVLHVHALRAGDAFTVAKSLGRVQSALGDGPRAIDSELDSDGDDQARMAFSLELYPSQEQRDIAGRYIAAALERRRSGAGTVASDDRWMQESLSLPGGVTMPRLRWAKKEVEPSTAAHVAVAFDTFESSVLVDAEEERAEMRSHAFGMLSFFDREFTPGDLPSWRSGVPSMKGGERHPAERGHTDRLNRVQEALHRAVARHLGTQNGDGRVVLHTSVPREKEDDLRRLHALSDWVVTLDRNAGIEYFDSPRDNPSIYDAYVIDCVPEREDLGALQLVTSTSNLSEVRLLLDRALDGMGLSHSRRNAEFLLSNLKALSGRLAIRLTGTAVPAAELIALAVAHANCVEAAQADPCWLPLTDGFIVPIDDVQDLLPAIRSDDSERGVRPDLLYVSPSRNGLRFCFVEVKYRRDLGAARSPSLLEAIHEQTESVRKRWEAHFSDDQCSIFLAIRRAKLSRVLRFYVDKARRHHLSERSHKVLLREIGRLVESGRAYTYEGRGWVFCPEHVDQEPEEILLAESNGPPVFLFGASPLPEAMPPPATPGTSGPPAPPAADRTTLNLVSGPDAQPPEAARITLGTDARSPEESVTWHPSTAGNPHLLVAGLPGMGKTTCLLNLCRQMVDAKISPIVFSYHEDIDEKLEASVESLRFVDFNGLGFNPLHVMDRDNQMAHLDVAGAIRDIFTAVYPDLGDIQADRIRKAIRDSFTELGWGGSASAADLEEPAFGRFVQILRADPRPDRSLRSLLARLDELDDYGLFASGNSSESLWDRGHTTVVRIHSTQSENLQRAFASLVFYGLYKDMFRRGIQERITHAVVFDEAHRAGRLKLIPTMAKECRKYGISLVLASQEARDFHTSVFSAIANYLVLRLTETDAKALVRNVADSRQQRALVDRIKQIERFKALFFREGRTQASRVDLLP